jgi:hypothetical protein
MITLDMMDEYVVAFTERLRDKLGDKVITRGNWGDAESPDIERFFSQKKNQSSEMVDTLNKT